jgi:Common central domain of tyrosinase
MISLALTVYVFATSISLAQNAGNVYVRKNASSPAAQADLDALNVAIGKMKGLPCDDPTSWYYQGGIHWVPDDVEDGSNLKNGNPFCAGYNGTTATLKPAWDNCTHTTGMELHFLVWHRLYIYYFEDIVRAKSGKADFALPYWNYVDQKDAVMPPVFAKKNSNVFESARCTVLNKGKPIESKEYGPGKDLDISHLMTNTLYSLFNDAIDNAPHGAMHVYIGGRINGETFSNPIYQARLPGKGGVMAHVPSAAFDPIFWLHHAEIDFLWQQWMKSPKGQKPNLAQLQAAPIHYNFFGRNGNPVTLTVEQAYNMVFSLPVTYDSIQATANFAEVTSLMNEKPQESATAPTEIAHSATPHVIKGKETSFSTKLETNAVGLADIIASQANRRVVLHLTVSFTKEPTGSYHVYLQNGADEQRGSTPKFIGNMTFFGAGLHARHGVATAGAEHKLTKSFQFDVSNEIDLKTFNGNLHLLIKKDGDPNGRDELTVEDQSLKLH